MSFLKLKEIDQFKLDAYEGHSYVKWDEESRKMLRSETPQEGYRLEFKVRCGDDTLSLSGHQFGLLLQALYVSGKKDPEGVAFKVTKSGEGRDIKYYFNVLDSTPSPTDDTSLDDLPFDK